MNYYEIDSFNPLLETFAIPEEFVPIRRLKPEEVLSKEAIAKFNKLGLQLREVQMFTTQPHKFTGIHIDSHDGRISKGAVNYVVGPGSMIWYKLKNDTTTKLETPAGTTYMLYEADNCEVIDELPLTKLTLVRTNVPHNISNLTDEFRYCFSIRFEQNNFEELFERLKSWNDSTN